MAVTEKNEAKRVSSSSVERGGSAGADATGAASICNSFWEAGGGEAGAVGMPFSAGLAQQAGVEQFFESQPLQQQLDFLPLALGPAAADTRKTL
jgi:hypothetical protein